MEHIFYSEFYIVRFEMKSHKVENCQEFVLVVKVLKTFPYKEQLKEFEAFSLEKGILVVLVEGGVIRAGKVHIHCLQSSEQLLHQRD